jgi:hypothetical protein
MPEIVERLERLTRVCKRCHQPKPWSAFRASTLWRDGQVRTVVPYCRECDSKRAMEWDRANIERKRARQRAWLRRRREQGRRRLDVGPLQAFLIADGRPKVIVAEITGVSERTITRILQHQQETVSPVTADQIITRLDGCLELVYPSGGE